MTPKRYVAVALFKRNETAFEHTNAHETLHSAKFKIFQCNVTKNATICVTFQKCQFSPWGKLTTG